MGPGVIQMTSISKFGQTNIPHGFSVELSIRDDSRLTEDVAIDTLE
jgi:hypothetical protein